MPPRAARPARGARAKLGAGAAHGTDSQRHSSRGLLLLRSRCQARTVHEMRPLRAVAVACLVAAAAAAAPGAGSRRVGSGRHGATAPPTIPSVPPGHPRVYLRPTDLPTLRAKSKDHSARRLWQAVTNRASDPVVLAFTGLLEQDPTRCAEAVKEMGKTLHKTVSYTGKWFAVVIVELDQLLC